jgi:hypothetical protein
VTSEDLVAGIGTRREVRRQPGKAR